MVGNLRLAKHNDPRNTYLTCFKTYPWGGEASFKKKKKKNQYSKIQAQ